MPMKRTKTINAFTDAFIEKKLDPVKHFNEVYRGVSKEFPGLVGHSIVNLIEGKKTNHKVTLLRMSIEPAKDYQPFIIAVYYFKQLIIVDLLSSNASVKKIAEKHEKKLIHHAFAFKSGSLSVDSEKMINFSETNDLNSLAAFVISACGFTSNINSASGEKIIEKIIEKG